MVNEITAKKEEDFNKWYHEIIGASGLVFTSNVQGCIVYSDYCIAIWNLIREFLDRNLRNLGFKEYSFPSLISLSSFEKEKRHFNDFFRETLVVTSAGNKKLNEKFVLRPTSEAIIYESFAKWVNDAKDLPLLVNQYCSVIRWESLKPNMPLIRGNEFLWQESHSAHSTEQEADKFVVGILDIYRQLHQDYLALPFVEGFKPNHRMFPGAKYTMALESLMPDLKSVQTATSHSLGQNFSSVFNIGFKDASGKKNHVWQACNGITTRIIGATIMMHSDNYGMVLPPKIAPFQCVLFGEFNPILNSLKEKNIRFIVDKSDADFEEKLGHWRLMGAPTIVYREKGDYVCERRDKLQKFFPGKNIVVPEIIKALGSIQDTLLENAEKFKLNHTCGANSWGEFEQISEKKGGFIRAQWCGEVSCAREIKQKTGNSLRIINPAKNRGKCVNCRKNSRHSAIFAPAY